MLRPGFLLVLCLFCYSTTSASEDSGVKPYLTNDEVGRWVASKLGLALVEIINPIQRGTRRKLYNDPIIRTLEDKLYQVRTVYNPRKKLITILTIIDVSKPDGKPESNGQNSGLQESGGGHGGTEEVENILQNLTEEKPGVKPFSQPVLKPQFSGSHKPGYKPKPGKPISQFSSKPYPPHAYKPSSQYSSKPYSPHPYYEGGNPSSGGVYSAHGEASSANAVLQQLLNMGAQSDGALGQFGSLGLNHGQNVGAGYSGNAQGNSYHGLGNFVKPGKYSALPIPNLNPNLKPPYLSPPKYPGLYQSTGIPNLMQTYSPSGLSAQHLPSRPGLYAGTKPGNANLVAELLQMLYPNGMPGSNSGRPSKPNLYQTKPSKPGSLQSLYPNGMAGYNGGKQPGKPVGFYSQKPGKKPASNNEIQTAMETLQLLYPNGIPGVNSGKLPAKLTGLFEAQQGSSRPDKSSILAFLQSLISQGLSIFEENGNKPWYKPGKKPSNNVYQLPTCKPQSAHHQQKPQKNPRYPVDEDEDDNDDNTDEVDNDQNEDNDESQESDEQDDENSDENNDENNIEDSDESDENNKDEDEYDED